MWEQTHMQEREAGVDRADVQTGVERTQPQGIHILQFQPNLYIVHHHYTKLSCKSNATSISCTTNLTSIPWFCLPCSWDIVNSRPILRLQAHNAPVVSCDISLDGTRAYTLDSEGHAHLWYLEMQVRAGDVKGRGEGGCCHRTCVWHIVTCQWFGLNRSHWTWRATPTPPVVLGDAGEGYEGGCGGMVRPTPTCGVSLFSFGDAGEGYDGGGR